MHTQRRVTSAPLRRPTTPHYSNQLNTPTRAATSNPPTRPQHLIRPVPIAHSAAQKRKEITDHANPEGNGPQRAKERGRRGSTGPPQPEQRRQKHHLRGSQHRPPTWLQWTGIARKSVEHVRTLYDSWKVCTSERANRTCLPDILQQAMLPRCMPGR